MPEEWVTLRDLTGPYRGTLQPYLKSAGENAIMSGYAELPADEGLPEDFPGREALAAAGIDTVEGVAELADPTAIDGIGAATAKKIVTALAERGA